MATSKIKSDSIDSIDAVKITTGTVDNARITLDAAEVPNLDASKITTGSIADARVPASAVTQHVTATDLSPIENDLAVLALQNAINGNMTAHGLNNYWIEQFEDSDSITALTTCARNSDEYVSSTIVGSSSWETGNRSIGVTGSPSVSDGNYLNWVDGDTTLSSSRAWYWDDNGTVDSNRWIKLDFNAVDGGSGATRLITEFRYHSGGYSGSNPDSGTFKWQGSNNDSDWTDIGSNWAMATNSGWNTFSTTINNNATAYRYYKIVGVSGTSHNPWMTEVEFKVASLTVSATGSFTSTTITPQDSASKNSLGLVLLYKNNAGTNTLNTDIVAKVSADNGSNYSTCVLASKGTFSTGINIAIAPAISVTAGTQLKYKIEFANQASGSKEAQIHGVALQY